MANLSWFPLMLLLLFIHLSKTTQAINHKHNGLSFRLIHSDSLNLHSHQSNLSVEQKIDRLIHLSEVQIKSREGHFHGKNSSLSRPLNKIIRPLLYERIPYGLFLVQVGIGTFAYSPKYKTYYLILDTAGGLTWTQCEGCDPCFHQRDPVFPKNQSKSYHSYTCKQCPPGTTCEQGHCMFDILYGGGTSVQGIAATETFTFGSNNADLVIQIPNLGFGCVIRSKYFASGTYDKSIVSGILGMSRHFSSFINQARALLGGRFSYCLTPFNHQSQRSSMFLRFGDDIPPLSSRYQHRTPLIHGPTDYYYLDLRAISVGSETLKFNPSVFKLRPDGSGGCFIDSGSSSSRLVNIVYRKFERVLNRKIVAENPGITMVYRKGRLCYKQPRPRTRTKFPRVTFHFANNAKFVVEQEAYMMGFMDPDPQVYCLMILPYNSSTMIGANLQVNYRIIYDIVNSKLLFAPTNCFSNN